jgi:hypothetical protein
VKAAIALSLLFLLGGCGAADTAAPAPQRTALEQALIDAPPERRFQGQLGGQDVHFVLHDCALYRAAPAGVLPAWALVLEPEPYPFFTSCERQSMQFARGALTVNLGRMAFGAGGCCATGGNWRSSDGRNWKKL